MKKQHNSTVRRLGMATSLLGVLLCSSAFAAEPTDSFNQGTSEFKAGNYSSAVKSFKRAEANGMKNDSLYYNLGASYYKLGQYDKAYSSFERLTSSKRMQQVAYYNLGLIATKQDRDKTALQWFEKARTTGSDEKLKKLSSTAIARLKKNDKGWKGVLSLSAGHDDNVGLASDETELTQEESDNFFELYAGASRIVQGNRNNGVRVFARVSSLLFGSEDDSDFTLVGGGVTLHKKYGKWKTRGTIGYDQLYLGGNDFEGIVNLVAEGRRKLDANKELRLRYRFSHIIAGDNEFEYLEGQRHRARAELRIKQNDVRYRLAYQLEVNDRDDRRTATTFSSSSPVRHTFRANVRFPVAPKWTGELDGRYRISRYRDSNVESDGSRERREDERFRFKAGLNYKLDSDTTVFGHYRYTENDSNLDTRTYERNQFTIGINRYF